MGLGGRHRIIPWSGASGKDAAQAMGPKTVSKAPESGAEPGADSPSLRGTQPCGPLHLRLLASRTERSCVSVVLSLWGCLFMAALGLLYKDHAQRPVLCPGFCPGDKLARGEAPLPPSWTPCPRASPCVPHASAPLTADPRLWVGQGFLSRWDRQDSRMAEAGGPRVASGPETSSR